MAEYFIEIMFFRMMLSFFNGMLVIASMGSPLSIHTGIFNRSMFLNTGGNMIDHNYAIWFDGQINNPCIAKIKPNSCLLFHNIDVINDVQKSNLFRIIHLIKITYKGDLPHPEN